MAGCNIGASGDLGELLFRAETHFGILHHSTIDPDALPGPDGPLVAPVTTNPTYKIPIVSESIARTKNLIESDTLPGIERSVQFLADGNSDISGDVTGEILPEGLEQIWFYGIGTPGGNPVATTGSGPFTHVFQGGLLPCSFTLEKNFPDINVALRYLGNRIATLAWNFPQEGFPTWTMSILGADEVIPTRLLPPYPPNPTALEAPLSVTPLVPTKRAFEAKSAMLFEGGNAVGFATTLDITLDNQLATDQFVIGKEGRIGSAEGKRVITGSMSVFFTDIALYTKFVNSTATSIQVMLSNSSGDTFSLLLPSVRLSGETPQLSGPGPVTQTISFTAQRDIATGTDIVLTLVNSVSSIPVTIP